MVRVTLCAGLGEPEACVIWLVKLTQETASARLVTRVDRVEHGSEKVLDEADALLAPRRVEKQQGAGIDEERGVIPDVDVNKVELRLVNAKSVVL